KNVVIGGGLAGVATANALQDPENTLGVQAGPETMGDMGPKPIGQAADRLGIGANPVQAAAFASDPHGEVVKSQELGLAIAASKYLSGAGFVDAQVVGPVEPVVVGHDDAGRPIVRHQLTVELRGSDGATVRKTEVVSENVVLTAGMGTPRRLATEDQM